LCIAAIRNAVTAKKRKLIYAFQDFGAVWRVVDENDDGAIDYGEFMRAFIGNNSLDCALLSAE